MRVELTEEELLIMVGALETELSSEDSGNNNDDDHDETIKNVAALQKKLEQAIPDRCNKHQQSAEQKRTLSDASVRYHFVTKWIKENFYTLDPRPIPNNSWHKPLPHDISMVLKCSTGVVHMRIADMSDSEIRVVMKACRALGYPVVLDGKEVDLKDSVI